MNSVQNWSQKVNEGKTDWQADAYPNLIYHKIKPSQMEKAEFLLRLMAVETDSTNIIRSLT